jgi:phosphatidylglycerol lysyltransferase
MRIDRSRVSSSPADVGGTGCISTGIGPRRRWLYRSVAGLIICAIAGLVFWRLERALAGVSPDALATALQETPRSALEMALAATAASYVTLFGYDLSGLRYARARPPLLSALLASFCGYAIGNALGFGVFSGGAVRYRIYSAAGLSAGQIARVILFISVAIGVGLGSLAAIGLLLCADRAGRLLGIPPEPVQAAGMVLLMAALSVVAFLAIRQRPLKIGLLSIEPPGAGLIAAQLAVTIADILAAAAVLWFLLPPTGIDFFQFAAIFAAALGLGVLSHVPGGLGVFELVILYAVGDKAPVSAVAAALLAYRAIYFLVPLSVSTVLLAGFEARRLFNAKLVRRRANRALLPQ